MRILRGDLDPISAAMAGDEVTVDNLAQLLAFKQANPNPNPNPNSYPIPNPNRTPNRIPDPDPNPYANPNPTQAFCFRRDAYDEFVVAGEEQARKTSAAGAAEAVGAAAGEAVGAGAAAVGAAAVRDVAMPLQSPQRGGDRQPPLSSPLTRGGGQPTLAAPRPPYLAREIEEVSDAVRS